MIITGRIATIYPDLPSCDRFADCLVRMPMYYELQDAEVKMIVDEIKNFFARKPNL